MDTGTEALEFIHVLKAAVPHALGHETGALSKGQHRDDLGLHIRGEAGVRHGFHIGAAQRAVAANEDLVAVFLNIHAHLTELDADAVHMLGDDVLNKHLSPCGGDGSHIGARLDLIGDDGVGAARQTLHAADADRIGTGTLHIGAHGV